MHWKGRGLPLEHLTATDVSSRVHVIIIYCPNLLGLLGDVAGLLH